MARPPSTFQQLVQLCQLNTVTGEELEEVSGFECRLTLLLILRQAVTAASGSGRLPPGRYKGCCAPWAGYQATVRLWWPGHNGYIDVA